MLMTVKRGGIAGPRGYLFELTGGDLSLDLANTVDNRPTGRRRELLGSYADLIAWGGQSGAITAAEAGRLRRLAARRPTDAREALKRAIRIREAIFAMFSAIAEDRPPPRDALMTLNAALPEALRRLRLVSSRGAVEWRWADRPESLDRILFTVARAAADLLVAGNLDRVRECAAGRCAWLFLDSSRNRSRRWCDMSTCGNRSKARRHYQRQHGG